LYLLLPLFVIVKIFIIRLCDKHNRNKNFTNKFLLFTVLISSTYLFILSLYLSTIEERIGLIRPQSYQERSKTKIFRSQDEHSHDQLHSYSLRFYMAVSILNFTCNQMFPFDGHLLATSTQQTTKLQIMNLTLTSRSMTSFLCYYCY
jgi:hypothetical protein